MYHTTGFSKEQIVGICARVMQAYPRKEQITGRRPALGVFKSIAITLTYLRRNHVQQELGEYYGVSQATVSRTISQYVPILGAVFGHCIPTVEDLDPGVQYIVDGTLLPCWSWDDRPELYSGKHHTTGVNVQVACTLDGQLVWVSDPMPGRTHDAKAIRESGLLDIPDIPDQAAPRHLGDKGYIGLGMITPVRRPAHRGLLDEEKLFNRHVNQIRYQIERTIANFKTWRILHTDYRRPYAKFAETITTIIALEFYRSGF